MDESFAFDRALSWERSRKFWLASGLAGFLALLSYTNLQFIHFFNGHVFHTDRAASAGWDVYTVFRLAPFFYLIYVLVSMALPVKAAAGTTAKQKVQVKETLFDPLMGLRAFACFLVVMGHYFMVVMPFSRQGVWRPVVALLESSPWAGVWVFFTLSGFLMAKGFASGRYTLDEVGMRAFLRNRFLRIAPIYYGSILVISVFKYPEIFERRNWWMAVQICGFDFRGDLPITEVGALWSVSTEMQFYLIVPMLMVGLLMVRQRLGRWFPVVPVVVIVLGTVVKMLLVRHTHMFWAYGYSSMLGNLDIFVCGMSISLFPRWKPAGTEGRGWIGPALAAGTAIFYVGLCGITGARGMLHMTLNDYWAEVPWLAVVFSTGFIYLAEGRGKVRLRRDLTGGLLRGVQWAGTLTYCLYVFHSDVFLTLAKVVPSPHSIWVSLAKFPTAMVETFAVAALFYYMVEKPFEKRKHVAGTALMDAP